MDPLASPLAKLGRARKHLNDLHAEIQAFFATGPYVVRTRRDPTTRRLVYYVHSVRPTPAQLADIAGDAVHALRSALDHLAYQLVISGTGQPGPFSHVYFPIWDTRKEHDAKKTRQTRGMTAAALGAIDAVQPYQGGNQVLWRLHKLDNIDKHRELITVGSAFQSVDIGVDLQASMQALVGRGSGEGDVPLVVPPLSLFLRPEDKLCPLKAGDELFVDLPDAQERRREFPFTVAFNEPPILPVGEPVLETLTATADEVGKVIAGFRSLL